MCAGAGDAAHAQALDCDRLKTTSTPYEIRMNVEIIGPGTGAGQPANVPRVVQVYRSDAGPSTAYAKQGDVLIKTLAYGPFPVETINSKTDARISEIEYVGIDVKSVDIDKDHSYEVVVTSGNGQVQRLLVDRRVAGRRTVRVDTCPLDVVVSIAKNTNKADGSLVNVVEVEYSPQLQQVLTSKIATPAGRAMIYTAMTIDTRFEPLAGK